MEQGMRLDDVVLSSTICLGNGVEPLKLRAYQIGGHIEMNPVCAFSCGDKCGSNCPCQGNCSCVDDTWHSEADHPKTVRYDLLILAGNYKH